ncbi:MAG TPA: pilus assembly protein [Pseudolabrys sp.]|nr:pilus assembly protein [Pseudolabrys sp.]
MSTNKILSHIGRWARAFVAAREANVAITFAIATIPIIGAVGAAIDYSHANSIKAALQSALDSTGLMLSRDAASLTNTQLQSKAQSYFTAMFTRPEAKNVTVTANYNASSGSQVLLNASASLDTNFVGILGYKTITVTASSTAKWGSTRLRVGLVLDNTGSMADDGKMDALKTATKNLLTQLKNAASQNGDVYVSIIPFAKDVNVGSTNATQTWVDSSFWLTSFLNKLLCGLSLNLVCFQQKWNGCVMDRGDSNGPNSNNYDQNVAEPKTSIQATLFAAEQESGCPTQMKGLSYDWDAMKTLVDNMSPGGNTNQPIGLIWGWQSLVGGAGLTAPAMDPNYQYQQIIILMSDGLNTENRWSNKQSTIDKRMYDPSNGSGTCANIKAAGITLYMVQVNTGGDPTSTLMQNCASSADKFYELKNANDLITTFNAIGTNLTKLRVAR